MTEADFRRIALSFSDAVEGTHAGIADFRYGGSTFATLAAVSQGYGNLMLTPDQQAGFLADAPGLFLPVKGGWGRMGITHIRLAEATEDVLRGALTTAYNLRVEKSKKSRRKPKKTT